MPDLEASDEKSHLVPKDDEERTAEQVLPNLSKLQNGLRGWIRVNKTRKAKLQQTVDKCEDITKHSSDFESLMSESKNIVAKQAATITRTNEKLQFQTEQLGTLKEVAEQIGKRMRDIGDYSPWGPPWEIMCCSFICAIIMVVLVIIPYVLNMYGIYKLDIKDWFKSQYDDYQKNNHGVEADAVVKQSWS